MEKQNLLVSFSGGETSAYMAQWLWNNKRDEYNMIFVFANTGQENYETIRFVQQCSEHFGFPVVWVEADVHHGKRKATTSKIVNFRTAAVDGEPFEEVIKKYGIPNQAFPHCTRELKQNPIRHYAKSVFGPNYLTAIGIREDEFDRMNENHRDFKLIYPLISMRPMTKPKINFWWEQQPFRLELKGYQGNCITCWKKSDSKLFQIAKENKYAFNFMGTMEARYGRHTRPGGEEQRGITFFRKNRSAIDMVQQAREWTGSVMDDAQVFDDTESCEVLSNCGDL